MVEKLMKIAQVSQAGFFDKQEFEKFNGEALEPYDLFLKDYKDYTKEINIGSSLHS